MTDIATLIESLGELDTDLHENDFLLSWDHSEANIRALLSTAEILEALYLENIDCRAFTSGLAVSIFRDNSTRTRFSFASAASLLGLSSMDLDETRSQIAHGETVRETANMISFLTQVIGIRDDIFLGAGHEYMVEVSESVRQGHAEGVLPQKPAIVNLQCDRDHPTQTVADLLHLQKTFGSLEALRGKKIAMTWAYSPSYGKPLSVPQGIIGLLTRFGMDVSLAYPEGYGLMPEIVGTAKQQAEASGGSLEITHSMEEAFTDADIVYPKSWAPYEVMLRRTEYLRAGQNDRLAALEKECLAMNEKHLDWECNEPLMAATRGGEALYMHCLPADISGVSCEHGEVAASVFDRYRTATYHEASHKPYVIAAMILANRFARPDRLLSQLADRAAPRQLTD